tara:strand:+ start:42171 stop:44345 length:2175 start_codon:yes stop_codon:yes gene_type:complete
MKTKIIVTVGPSSLYKDAIQKMDSFGADYFRINLSHTKIDEIESMVYQLKKWTNKKICLDTEGAQLRTEEIEKNQLFLEKGGELKIIGNSPNLLDDGLKLNVKNPGELLSIGDVLNIDFNGASVQVIDIIDNNSILVRVLKEGLVLSNKGIGVDREISMPSFSKKDIEIFSIAEKIGINTVFLSFSSSSKEVRKIRSIFNNKVEVISKIENRIGIKNIQQICDASDAILIDRGDLSRDVQLEKIPNAQKYIIDQAKISRTPVYIATNLMESMLNNSQPTRAELNDIVGSINSGASGLVLAAETAIGKYPIDAVRIMSTIIHENKKNDNDFNTLFNFDSPILNEPHGGTLIQQFSQYTEDEIYNFQSIVIDQKAITDTLQICNGTYSPINRFMSIDEIKSILDNYKLRDEFAWTLPIILQISSDQEKHITLHEPITLKSLDGNIVAVLEIDQVEKLEKIKNKIKKWFGTEDISHPGLNDLLCRGEYILSGKPYLIEKNSNKYYSKYELTPRQSRSLFHSYGWHKIIGFHTRNIPHMGHEYIQKNALSKISADALFISPVVGIKKQGDFKSEIIIKCYNKLINSSLYDPFKVIIGAFNTYSRYCGPREAVFTAICRKNYGCSHFIIGRDHTGVGDFYNSKDSKDIFNNLDIGISVIPFDEIIYDSNENYYFELDNSINKSKIKKISATLLRESIQNNTFENDYLVNDIVYKTIIDSLTNNEELFII